MSAALLARPTLGATRVPTAAARRSRAVVVRCSSEETPVTRRETILMSVNTAVIGALFTWGTTPRPGGLGIRDYGGGAKTLALCPPSPNCVATSEEANDITHYAPPLTYNPEDGRGRTNPASQEQAMAELVAVVSELKPDNFTPKIVTRTDDYLYVEYESPTFGFIDDVEFWFKPGKYSRLEYRSASRIGESDGSINRKRIKAIREALQKKGWASAGF